MNGTEDGVQPQLDSNTIEKLTDWEKEPSLIDLKADLEAAKSAHRAQMTRIGEWNSLMKVEGKEKPTARKGRSTVQPKLVRRQAEWRYSALSEPFLGSNKLYKISPVTFEDTEGARQNELVLNWQFRTKLNRIKFIDDFVRSTVDEGTCIVRTGWVRNTIKVKKEVPVYAYYAPETQEQVQQFQQALQLSQEDPRTYAETVDPAIQASVDFYAETSQVTVARQTRTEEVEVEEVIENRPDLKIFHPNNVIIDPSCEGDIDKAMFAVFTIETSKAELLKEGKRYKNLDKINWEDASPNNEAEHESKTPGDFQFKDALRKRVVAYEYWGFYDVNNNGTLTPFVCTWIGNTIIRMEENPFPDKKLPIVVVPYLPIKRELYGEPDAELLGDNQRILGAVTRGMIDLLGRSANSQQGFAKGMLDPLNRRRFDNGQDYEFNPNVNPQMGHIMHKFPELPQSAFALLGLQNQEAEALTGVKAFSGGLSGDSYGDVATGIKGVLDAASKREMAILRRLAKGMVDIGRKIIAMNAEFLSEEEVVRVTNEQFVTIRREDLKGDFDLEVDISTAEIDNAQAQDLAFMLQTLGNSMEFGITKIILRDIARLKKMPELANEISNYEPQPDPMVQKQKELELLKLEKEIEKIDSEIMANQAKAQKDVSETGLNEIDAIGELDGTKHARGLEQQRAQARGNQSLEVTKALTKPRKPDEIGPDIEAAVGFNELTDLRDGTPAVGL